MPSVNGVPPPIFERRSAAPGKGRDKKIERDIVWRKGDKGLRNREEERGQRD